MYKYVLLSRLSGRNYQINKVERKIVANENTMT